MPRGSSPCRPASPARCPASCWPGTTRGQGGGAGDAGAVWRGRLLSGAPGSQAAQRPGHQPGAHPHPPGDGHPPGGDQRRPLSPPGGRGDAGHPHVHPDGQDGGRSQPPADGDQRAVCQIHRGDGRSVPPTTRRRWRTRSKSRSCAIWTSSSASTTCPSSSCPRGYTDGDAYFQKLCEEGFARRYPGAPAEYRERLAYEMGIIRQMGFVDYFLIVSDFIGYAKGRGHPRGPWPGLGGRLHGGLLHGHHRRGPDEILPLL